MSKNDKLFEEIPTLTGKEFAFIRRRCGFTQAFVARKCGFLSRSAVWAWEQKQFVEPYQTKLLMTLAESDLFNTARRMYKEQNTKP